MSRFKIQLHQFPHLIDSPPGYSCNMKNIRCNDHGALCVFFAFCSYKVFVDLRVIWCIIMQKLYLKFKD